MLPAKHTVFMSKNIFFLAIILAASGLVSPPIALLGGLIFGFGAAHPFHVESKRLAKFLLQASVVALGFGWKWPVTISRRTVSKGRHVSPRWQPNKAGASLIRRKTSGDCAHLSPLRFLLRLEPDLL